MGGTFTLAFILTVGVIGCAVVMPPSGGPEDRIPPTVERCNVPNGAVGIGRSIAIELTFSEYVERGEVERNIIVTPSTTIQYSWTGRTLTVILDSLHRETTYRLSLAPTYHDLRGNRATEPYTVVFSTGDRLDSCQIRGSIVSTDARQYYALLIPRDSARQNRQYQIPAAADGTFLAERLPCEEFIVAAFADGNANARFDSGEDCGIAFKPIRATVSATPIRVWLGPCQSPSPITILAVRALTNRRIQVTTTHTLSQVASTDWKVINQQTGQTISITGAYDDGNERFVLILAEHLDANMRYRLQPTHPIIRTNNDNVFVDTSGVEFIGTGVNDTLELYLKSSTPSRDTVWNEPLTPQLHLIWSDALEQLPTIELHNTNTGRVVPIVINRWDDAHVVAQPRDSLAPATVYQWRVQLRHAVSWKGTPSQDTGTLIRTLITLDTRQGGRVRGTVIDTCCHCRHAVVVVRSSRGNIVSTVAADTLGNFALAYLPEGEYLFDAYCDEDANGRYDSGSIKPLRFGERVAVTPIRATIKARWETTGVIIRLEQ